MSYSVNVPDEKYWQELINCQSACPVGTDARGYVRALAQGKYEEAYLIARGPNPLASICGRICAAPCEVNCRRGDIDKPVSIRALKRFASEQYYSTHSDKMILSVLDNIRKYVSNRENLSVNELTLIDKETPKTQKKVAIIGSGPAGLACAHDLALYGIKSTVFETEPVAGGMLAVGIPDYRLPRDIIQREVEIIKELGVEFKVNTTVGKDVLFSQLATEFDAVIVAVGAKRSRSIPMPGFDHNQVLGGVEFLRDFYVGKDTPLGEKIVVIGGGSVAYDIGRSALRYGQFDISRQAKRMEGVREVHLCCLESLEEMMADEVEIIEGAEEGIKRLNSVGPHEVLFEGDKLVGIKFKKCLSVLNTEGKFAPVFDENDITTIECDNIMMAIGQQIDLSFINPKTDRLSFNDYGLVSVNKDGSTDVPNIFFAGDCAYGTKLVIDAVADGKKVAQTIAKQIVGLQITPKLELNHATLENYAREASYEETKRQEIPALEVEERLKLKRPPVELGYTELDVISEAARCLDCSVNTIFNGDVCVLCGGCADVCPELCLQLVSVKELAIQNNFDLKASGFAEDDSAIIKDETKCIRCACCADRCPVGAITMERVTFCEIGGNNG